MSARTTSSGTSAIHVSTQPQTTHHVNKSVDFFFTTFLSQPPTNSHWQDIAYRTGGGKHIQYRKSLLSLKHVNEKKVCTILIYEL